MFFIDFSNSMASTLSSTQRTPSSHKPWSTDPLLQHHQHITTKVCINVVFINIFINTSPLPHNIVHMMDI
jgi:hypothetical protein